MYIEVLNDQNKPILSEKVRLTEGTGFGSIYIPRSIQTGTYYLRAYTRWMTNFDPEYYFFDRIYIVNPFLPLETISDQTGKSPDFNIHFYAEKNRLVPGQNNYVAFRAMDQSGNGTDLEGWVVTTSGDTITSFHTYKYGFGLMSFTPRLNDQFRIITNYNGGYKEFPLNLPVLQNPVERTVINSNVTDESKKFNIAIQQNREHYITRDKVILTIKTTDSSEQPVSGDLSVSVYRSDGQVNLYHKNIYQYLYHTSCFPGYSLPPDDQVPFAEYDSLMMEKILSVIYASMDNTGHETGNLKGDRLIQPENRGNIISGIIINGQNGYPAPGVRMFLAIPGKNVQLYNIKSGTNGEFHFQVLEQYGRKDIILMPENNPEQYRIVLDNDFSEKFGNIQPVPFRPDEQTVRYLEKLMVNLQIQDAFGKIIPDQPDISAYEIPNIFDLQDEIILLEDYIRLPAVEELFVELVKSVNIKRRRGSFNLAVIDPLSNQPLSGEPLLLLDGVPVLDINPVIIYLDPVDIERIEVMSNWYIIGDKLYFSIINLITKKAEYGHFDLPTYAIRNSYLFAQYPVSLNTPDYSIENDSISMIPDYRNLLYWNPEIVTNKNGYATVSFYTSDDISDYKIVIQGLTKKGLAGYKEAVIPIKGTEE
ncbi:MAG: hypothetical protein AMS27_09850 [Bacteroides sp. SM23_62_1]|nr:MAG: hypothetical protein AMS27_09850 [Bacteroides sp. SM23_62_1]